MWTNLHRRISIWLGRQDIIFRYLGWDHKRTKQKRKRFENLEPSDD